MSGNTDETSIGALTLSSEELAYAEPQRPGILWIGCSDSRVPESRVLGLPPGSVFVHRNIANQVPHGDINVLSVIQHAIGALNIRRIIVCGHTKCGGVRAALGDDDHGLMDHWLHNLRDVRDRNWSELSKIPDKNARAERLAELGAVAQVGNLRRHANIQALGNSLVIEAWIYDIVKGEKKVLPIPTPYSAAGVDG